MTKQSRAQEIGVTMQTLSNWERSGIDVFNDEQVRARIAKIKVLPENLKPEFRPKSKEVPQSLEPEEATDHTERLIAELAVCTDKHEAQRIKTQIDGLLNAFKLREAAGSYVSKGAVEEALLRIGATFKASVLRMEADLPPMMEGMDVASMQRVIRDKVDEALRSLDDEYRKVYEQSD